MAPDDAADLVVVGAGIVGLAHAYEAWRRGLRVHVIDRDHRAVGASVRSFGHICLSGQVDEALDHAESGRATWLKLGRLAGFDAAECGTVVVARAGDELAVLEEFAELRPGHARMLTRPEVLDHVPLTPGDVLGGAHLPLDLVVDQRHGVAAIAAWLGSRPGMSVSWATSLTSVEPGVANTSRGPIRTPRVVVCVNHDLDRLFPDLAAEAELRRCRLRMLQVARPHHRPVEPAVLTGSSLLRYRSFASRPSAADVRNRLLAAESPLLTESVNLMMTQLPSGDLIIGGTHHEAATHDPLADESLDQLLLTEWAALLGVARLIVTARWDGYHASAPGDFLVASPRPGTRVVSVTGGIGMTTAFGLAATVINGLAADPV